MSYVLAAFLVAVGGSPACAQTRADCTWVHDSCGDDSPSNPNGWAEIVKNGAPGANLENSKTCCYLFN